MVPIWDAGFVLGASATEQLRTFGGRLFRLNEHLDRLAQSLSIMGLDWPTPRHEIEAVANQIAHHNHGLLAPDSDLGLSLVVTPGSYASLAPPEASGPWFCISTYELPFARWATAYRVGQPLVTTIVEQVSSRSWPRRLKCRSRMHYYLADLEAARQDPAARALLLDADGTVVETATANILVYHRATGLISPPRESILPGISLDWVIELAAELNVSFEYRPLLPDDVARADEVWLTSTPYCLLPVTRFNHTPIAHGQPGPEWNRFIQRWSDHIGLNILDQATRRTAA